MLGIHNVAASLISRPVKELEKQLQGWRERPLAKHYYLIAMLQQAKVRVAGILQDAALIAMIGLNAHSSRRSVLSVQVSMSATYARWHEVFATLVKRGLHGVKYIVSDNHPGLCQAARSVFPEVRQQRCQFHLSQNARKHAPSMKMKREIGKRMRKEVWQQKTVAQAEQELRQLVQEYEEVAPKLADWLEGNIPRDLRCTRCLRSCVAV